MRNLVFSLALCMTGCAGSPVQIQSFPEGADVLVVAPGFAPRKVGQTPLVVDESVLGVPRGSFQLQVIKEGFLSENILVPPSTLNRLTQISVKMRESQAASASKACAQIEAELPQIAKGTAEVQQFIASKKLDQAEMSLRVLVAKYPSIAVFHVLLGNVYYLRRDFEGALASYRRAQDSSGNQEASRMIRKIEDIRGSRIPAGSGGAQ